MAKHLIIWSQVVWIVLFPVGFSVGDQSPAPSPAPISETLPELRLSEAVMCETLDSFKPMNPSVVFSVQTGSVMCFTAFDHVAKKSSIFHDWIRRDKLIFRKKLVLLSPRWSSVSSIQLREADKGAWRVEVRDASGNILKILRFSITD